MVTRVKSDTSAGRRGVASLVRISATKARLDFEFNEQTGDKAESFEVEVAFGEDGTIPEYVPFKKMKDGQKVQFSATMSESGKELLFAVPSSGYFEVKFDNFLGPKDEAPVFTTKDRKKGKGTYRFVDCLFEVTGGQWQGLKIKDGVWLGAKYWFRLYDNFAAGPEGELAVKGA